VIELFPNGKIKAAQDAFWSEIPEREYIWLLLRLRARIFPIGNMARRKMGVLIPTTLVDPTKEPTKPWVGRSLTKPKASLPETRRTPNSETRRTPNSEAIRNAKELGRLVRQMRLEAGMDQATAAGLAGVGIRFLGDVERGKPTTRLGLVLQLLERLGLQMHIVRRNVKA
jgi:HTH-type transcriptional regulator / antitoxin HipB